MRLSDRCLPAVHHVGWSSGARFAVQGDRVAAERRRHGCRVWRVDESDEPCWYWCWWWRWRWWSQQRRPVRVQQSPAADHPDNDVALRCRLFQYSVVEKYSLTSCRVADVVYQRSHAKNHTCCECDCSHGLNGHSSNGIRSQNHQLSHDFAGGPWACLMFLVESYQSDIGRFRAMTLSPLRSVANWPAKLFWTFWHVTRQQLIGRSNENCDWHVLQDQYYWFEIVSWKIC